MAAATSQPAFFDALPVAEQIQFVQDLWDRIGDRASESPLSEAWRDELDRRMAEDDADPEGGAPWEVVRERIRRRP